MVSETEHGVNYHHNSFPAPLWFSWEVIIILYLRLFCFLNNYHELRPKPFTSYGYNLSGCAILQLHQLPGEAFPLCLVDPPPETVLPSSGIWLPSMARLEVRQPPEYKEWERGPRDGCFSHFPIIFIFSSDSSILGLLMYFPWAHLVSSSQNYCIAIFPFCFPCLDGFMPLTFFFAVVVFVCLFVFDFSVGNTCRNVHPICSHCF